MNDWGISKGDWRDSNPHGKKVEDFILEFPEWMIYLRKDNRFPCPYHYSPSNEGSSDLDPTCPCMGLGVKITAQIIPAKMSRDKADLSVRTGEVRVDAGEVDALREVVIFPKVVAPQIDDIILLVDWNVRTQDVPKTTTARPIRIHSIYLIKGINPNFERELAYFSCGIRFWRLDQDLMNRLIPTQLTSMQLLTNSQWDNADFWNK